MPDHDHGLPTAPLIRPAETAGEYRLQGIRFHMPGRWRLELRMERGEIHDLFVVDFTI